ncbi:TPA: hypothetical protein N0F65_009944 [Lagenidium giganteum]|uniref:Glutaredoxin domain-containing protein n=1 Tax=Lagenidium giganteum TaxID=4803 RepID=A0AAV2YVW5_9STRA|nr:TPA: hypothetical protein N0F65_009944 [Lagenidium giganteum]
MTVTRVFHQLDTIDASIDVSSSVENSPSTSKATSPSSTMPSATEFVQDKTSNNAVVVFSKSYCPYCTKTKQLFKELGVSFVLVELDQISEGDDIQNALESLTGQRTVPNTFIGGKSVGGNSDIQALHKAGKLVPLLKDSGALA